MEGVQKEAQNPKYTEMFGQFFKKGDDKIVHIGFSCDGCDQTPIIGTRFKCNDCKNFDLCEKCHKTIVHEKSHTFTAVNTKMEDQEIYQELMKEVEQTEPKQPVEIKVELPNKVEIKEEIKEEEIKPEWESSLSLLQSMGFDNRNSNIELLKRHGGNVQRVVGELLK